MTELAKKLRIKEGHKLLVLNPPEDYRTGLPALPEEATQEIVLTPNQEMLDKLSGVADCLLLFVHGMAELQAWAAFAVSTLASEGMFWIAYPKQSSKINTDLNRDKGWEAITQAGFEGVAMVSIDSTWSGVRFRPAGLVKSTRTARTEKKAASPSGETKPAADRVVIVPDDLQAALVQSPQAQTFFEGLSYTNRKEYVRWVTDAKREETRLSRIQKTVERLESHLKNPWVKS
ncbi:YdeI/OmpD-associated family protein [Brevibacillus ruminantium]|uniref:YdeI/OmpD-associated family protein n=1 Tax=Brevibacillus ruminantium TaxID=2950604 RepID=A0ABY4WM53_9BACL|nr:YdeI/OmpD-associated family protein [Brevibacillus ruminantium]USG68240.1 YdeI/OmpD-associated family protein [Brevibacillus ruminantium]